MRLFARRTSARHHFPRSFLISSSTFLKESRTSSSSSASRFSVARSSSRVVSYKRKTAVPARSSEAVRLEAGRMGRE
jgi:hypothetical protein